MTKKIILLLVLMILTATNVEAAEEPPFDSPASTYTEGAQEILSLIRMKDDGEL